MTEDEKYTRSIVGGKLRQMATLVEEDLLDGFEIKWEKGSLTVDEVIKTKFPMKVVISMADFPAPTGEKS